MRSEQFVQALDAALSDRNAEAYGMAIVAEHHESCRCLQTRKRTGRIAMRCLWHMRLRGKMVEALVSGPMSDSRRGSITVTDNLQFADAPNGRRRRERKNVVF